MNAREFATAAVDFKPESWWSLELASLRPDGAENVFAAVARRAPASLDTLEKLEGDGNGCMSSCLTILALFGPLIMAPILWFLSAEDFDRSLFVIGVIAAIGALIVIGIEISDRAKGKKNRASGGLWMVVLIGLPAAFSAWTIWLRLGRGEAAEWLWWTMIPFVIYAAYSVIMLAFGLISPANPVSNWQQYVLAESQALAPDVALRIREDQTAAIETLAGANLISRADALRALRTNLGEMGMTMAPEVALPDPLARKMMF